MDSRDPAGNLPERENETSPPDSNQPEPQRMNRQQRRALEREMSKRMQKAGALRPGQRLRIPSAEKAEEMSLQEAIRNLRKDVAYIKAYLKRKFPKDWMEVSEGGVIKP